MNDIYLSLSEAARACPGHVHASTIFRWATRGLCRDGTAIRLEYRRVGRRVYTTAAWLEAFFQACTEADNPQPTLVPKPEAAPKPATTKQRAKQIARAEAILQKAGILPSATPAAQEI